MSSNSWTPGKFGDLVQIKNGYAFKSKDFDDVGDVLVVRQSNLNSDTVTKKNGKYLSKDYIEKHKDFVIQKNDILIGLSGSIGKYCTYNLDEPALLNQRVGKFLFKNANTAKYALYLYQHLINDVMAKTRGVGVQNVSSKDIESLPILIPSPIDQEKILAKIEELTSQIDDSVSQMTAALKQLKTYKTSALSKLYKDIEQKDPTILKKIGDVYEVFVGATPSRKILEYWNGSINWVSSGEVAFRDIKNTKELITEAGLNNTSTNLHPEGTVLLAMIGEGKTRGQAGILKVQAAHNQNTAAIRIDENTSTSEYLYYFLMSEYEKTRALGSGNNQKALNKSRVKEIKIPFPLLAEQEYLVSCALPIVTETEHLIEDVQSRIRQARSLKQSILSKAFKGELL